MATADAVLASLLARLDAAEQGLRDKDVQIQHLHTAMTAATASATSSQHSSVVDTRMLAKPGIFPGSQEAWADWVFTFRAYAAAVSPRMRELMDYAAKEDTPVIVNSGEDVFLSNQLYYILVMTVKEKALQKLKSVQDTNGLEAWRCFHAEWNRCSWGASRRC